MSTPENPSNEPAIATPHQLKQLYNTATDWLGAHTTPDYPEPETELVAGEAVAFLASIWATDKATTAEPSLYRVSIASNRIAQHDLLNDVFTRLHLDEAKPLVIEYSSPQEHEGHLGALEFILRPKSETDIDEVRLAVFPTGESVEVARSVHYLPESPQGQMGQAIRGHLDFPQRVSDDITPRERRPGEGPNMRDKLSTQEYDDLQAVVAHLDELVTTTE